MDMRGFVIEKITEKISLDFGWMSIDKGGVKAQGDGEGKKMSLIGLKLVIASQG